jgi:hypothetical protein
MLISYTSILLPSCSNSACLYLFTCSIFFLEMTPYVQYIYPFCICSLVYSLISGSTPSLYHIFCLSFCVYFHIFTSSCSRLLNLFFSLFIHWRICISYFIYTYKFLHRLCLLLALRNRLRKSFLRLAVITFFFYIFYPQLFFSWYFLFPHSNFLLVQFL